MRFTFGKMVLKVSLLNLGLLAMVVLISSQGEARILAETKESEYTYPIK